MELKHHEAVLKRGDSFVIDPRMLKVDVSYNVRDLSTTDTREHIAGLKESIANNGVRVPLEVRLSGTDIFVVSGHCRHAAVMELIAEGRDDILGVPCVREPSSINDAERTLNLVISNSGKPLTTLEVSEVVRRLEAFGWTEAEIQKRMRWKSRASVKQHLEVAALPEAMKDHIRKEEISPTTARAFAKSDLTPEQQEELVRADLEEKRRLGVGRRNAPKPKTTRKTLERDKPKSPAPKSVAASASAPSTVEPPLPQDDMTTGISDLGRALVEADAPRQSEPEPVARTMSEQELIEGLAARGYHVIKDEGGAAPDHQPTQMVEWQTETDLLAALIELTKQSHLCVQHNQSDDHPGWWSSDLVEAIRKARDVVERLSGKPMEFETIPDSMSQEVVTEDAA